MVRCERCFHMASTLLARSECLSERAAIASSRRGQGGKEEEGENNGREQRTSLIRGQGSSLLKLSFSKCIFLLYSNKGQAFIQ